MPKSKKKMLTAGKIKGTISKKTRAVELIQEAAEHLKDARKFLLDWDKSDGEPDFHDEHAETLDKIDEINEELIGMIGNLGSSHEKYADEKDDEGPSSRLQYEGEEDLEDDDEEEGDEDEEGEDNEEE